MVYVLVSMIMFFFSWPFTGTMAKYHSFIIHIMQFSYKQSIIPELDSSLEYQFNI